MDRGESLDLPKSLGWVISLSILEGLNNKKLNNLGEENHAFPGGCQKKAHPATGFFGDYPSWLAAPFLPFLSLLGTVHLL
jgi:hypothetical protein